MMAEEIRVLLVEPMQRPRLVTIPHTLEEMQKLVGGHIECVYPWEDKVGLVCGDEAKLNGDPANRLLEDYDIICGPFFICGLGDEDFISISDELAEKYRQKFFYPEIFFKTDEGVVCFKIGSPEEPKKVL